MKRDLARFLYGNPLICLLLLMPFVEPLYFTQIVFLDTIFYYWKLLSMGVIFFAWVLKPVGDRVLACIALFLLADCIVTVVGQGNVSQMITNAITILAMSILFLTAAEYHSISFLRAARLLFEVLIISNFIIIILFPEGIYNFTASNPHFLLGHRNVMMRTIFPGVCLEIICSIAECGKINLRAKFLIVLAALSLLFAWSATALFAYAVFCLFLIIYRKKELPKRFNVKLCCIISLAIFVLIVLLRMQNIFSFLIVDVLDKDLTFTGRTYLWDASLSNIAQAPIFGHGMEQQEVIGAKLYKYTIYDSAHNFYLDTLYQNGIFGAILLVIVFWYIAKVIDRKCKGEYYKLFVLAILTYGIMINFEPYINGDMRLFIPIMIYFYYFSKGAVFDSNNRLKSSMWLGKFPKKKIRIRFR